MVIIAIPIIFMAFGAIYELAKDRNEQQTHSDDLTRELEEMKRKLNQ
jgi:hypothetical protein